MSAFTDVRVCIAIVALAWLATAAPVARADAVAFERSPEAFPSRGGEPQPDVFDVVRADFDLDGDPDLLVNGHHVGPLELFENVEGRFQRVDPLRSGLWDDRGIPDLFAGSLGQRRALRRDPSPGLVVWADRRQGGAWSFWWPAGEPLDLELEGSLGFQKPTGLDGAGVQVEDDRHWRLQLPAGQRARSFSLHTRSPAEQLKLRAESDGSSPRLFVGSHRTLVEGGRLEVWKPDPHGMAWVDVEGSLRPELYITRGGLGGQLHPPLDPKEDRYFLGEAEGDRLHRRAPAGVVPHNHLRGRRVAWVDVDVDGRAELSVSNRRGPLALYSRGASGGAWEDRAPTLGLDRSGASVIAWLDVDDDGRDDCLVFDRDRIDVLVNRGDRFEPQSARQWGLVAGEERGPPRLIDRAALRVVDFDADGDLDVWLLAAGRQGVNRLFRRDGERFVDATASLGLASLSGSRDVVLLDADNDGFEDAASFGEEAVLWRNRGGTAFEPVPLDAVTDAGAVRAAAGLDADGDGRTDLFVHAGGPILLRNTTQNGNRSLEVALTGAGPEPVGTLVRVVTAGGRRAVRRIGSVHSTAFSQGQGTLLFGVAADDRVVSVEVRRPGSSRWTATPVAADATTFALPRRAAGG